MHLSYQQSFSWHHGYVSSSMTTPIYKCLHKFNLDIQIMVNVCKCSNLVVLYTSPGSTECQLEHTRQSYVVTKFSNWTELMLMETIKH